MSTSTRKYDPAKSRAIRAQFSWKGVNMRSKNAIFTDEMAAHIYIFVEAPSSYQFRKATGDPTIRVASKSTKGSSITMRRGSKYHFSGQL